VWAKINNALQEKAQGVFMKKNIVLFAGMLVITLVCGLTIVSCGGDGDGGGGGYTVTGTLTVTPDDGTIKFWKTTSNGAVTVKITGLPETAVISTDRDSDLWTGTVNNFTINDNTVWDIEITNCGSAELSFTATSTVDGYTSTVTGNTVELEIK
jgi:WD40 repeat protein